MTDTLTQNRKLRHNETVHELRRVVSLGYLPQELAQSIPEWFLLVDCGANVHVLYNTDLLAFVQTQHSPINWGGGSDMCIATGQLCGCVWMLDNGIWTKIVIHSGQPNTAWVIPTAHRPLFSTIQARRQGHDIIEQGPRPGICLFGNRSQFIPFVSDARNEFLLLPMYPPPTRSAQLFQPSFQCDMRVYNLNMRIDNGTFDPESVRAWASPAVHAQKRRSVPISAPVPSKLGRFISAPVLSKLSRLVKRQRLELPSTSVSTQQSAGTNGRARGARKSFPSAPVLGGETRARKMFQDSATAYDFIHAKLGHHGSMKRLINFKKHGKLIASQLPPKFLRAYKRPCRICLAMKKRKPRRPKALSPTDKALLSPWEIVQADSSGKFKVLSKLGNRYYTAFTCTFTGVRVVIPHAKRKHFPLVYLKFAQRIQRHPRILYTDMGGENLSKKLTDLWLAKDVLHLPVPKGEHFSVGSAEKAIGDLDQIQRGLSAEANAPSNVWDILTEHASLIDSMVNPSPSQPWMTKFEHLYGIKPNLDLLPKVGCFCVRIQEKQDRHDQKLDPLNLPGVFLGFATIRGCYGSVILTDKGTLISARYNVAYDEEYMPRHDINSSNPRMKTLQWLIGRGSDHTKQLTPFETDRTISWPSTMDLTSEDTPSSIVHDEDVKAPSRTKKPNQKHSSSLNDSDASSSDDDDVDIVLSQIEPRSALDVPSFSIFPPAKSPTGVMTIPLQGTGDIGTTSAENIRVQMNTSAQPKCRLRRSKRIVTKLDRARKLIKSQQNKSLHTRMNSDFDKIMTEFKRTSASSQVQHYAKRKAALNTKLMHLVHKALLPSASTANARFKRKCGLSSQLTADDLESNRSLLIGRRVHRFFPGFGGIYGTVMSYQASRQVYRIVYTDDTTEDLPYDDILLLMRKSKRRREAEANYASVTAHLMQAIFEAHAANGPSEYTEPTDIFKAWTAPDHIKWREAINKEMRLLGVEMDCWEEVDLASVPTEHTLLDSTWVFKIKYKADTDGKMVYDRHRARIVAKGFQQRKGIDYLHSFSPTASYVTIRLIMALTSIAGFFSYDLDATCAFISARLPPEEQVFMKAIPGFPLPEGRCLKLKSSLYGLVQAPRAYFLLCKEVYTKCGLTQLKSDECVFIRYVQNIKSAAALTPEDTINRGLFQSTRDDIPLEQRVYSDCPHSIAILIVAMYVDNNGCRTNAPALVDEFLAAVKEDGRILLNLEGNMSWFLSTRYSVDPVTGAIEADQHPYICTLLNKWGMAQCKPSQLPMKPTQDLVNLSIPATPNRFVISQYCMLIGELMFLSSNTVPTISHSVHAHARYMTNATHAHLDSAKTILRYLKGFVDSGRKLRWCAADVKPPTDPGRIFAYADSSWADVEPSRKSTYGYYLFVNNAAFAWKAALAPILALSTAEAELIAICACATEVIYVRKLANELGFLQTKPTIVYTDNQGAKALAEHTHFKGRSKHYQLRWTFIQDMVSQHFLVIHYCPREHMIADVQTAPRPFPVLDAFSKIIYGEVFAAVRLHGQQDYGPLRSKRTRSSERGGV